MYLTVELRLNLANTSAVVNTLKRIYRGRIAFFRRVFVIGSAFLLSLLGNSFSQSAQKVSPWSLPFWPFQSVDDNGNVSVWQPLGSLPLGSHYQIPLALGFESNREETSPYAGKGWLFPLFESTIYQVDENTFFLVQPDGQTRHLLRTKAGGAEVMDGSGWRGTVSADAIAITTAFGWVLNYQGGKITGFATPDGQTYSIQRSQFADSLVGPNGDTLIKIEFGTTDKPDVSIQLPSGSIRLEEANKPHVDTQPGGIHVVDHIDRSLSAIHFSNGTTTSYKYALDKMLSPTIAISTASGEKTIMWSPESKTIVSDDTGSYDVTHPSILQTVIARTGKDGKTESWGLDRTTGIETTKTKSGVVTTRHYFVSGPFNGKIRDESQQIADGKTSEKAIWSYDEQGRLIRFARNGAENQYKYNDDGRVKNITTAKGSTITQLYDEHGAYMGQETVYKNGNQVRLLKDDSTSMLMSFSIPSQGFATMPVSSESATSLYGQDANPIPNN